MLLIITLLTHVKAYNIVNSLLGRNDQCCQHLIGLIIPLVLILSKLRETENNVHLKQ